jgi:hypothetical protein
MRKPLRSLTDEERAERRRLRTDLAYYAGTHLTIRTKAGAAATLAFNRVQLHLHRRLEEQRARTGRVRALVLKFRQGGISTYIGARFYHRATHHAGTRVFISRTSRSPAFVMIARAGVHGSRLSR